MVVRVRFRTRVIIVVRVRVRVKSENGLSQGEVDCGEGCCCQG